VNDSMAALRQLVHEIFDVTVLHGERFPRSPT
jgi:hypothetical protein